MNTVADAILFLAGCDDGAVSTDGAGFSKFDTSFGQSLAQRIRSGAKLTEKQHAAARKLANKYRGQLQDAGFDLEAIKAEEFVAAGETTEPAEPAEPARVRLLAKIERRTEKAIFAHFPQCKIWLPLSQVIIEQASANTYLLNIPAWIARQKGLTAHLS